MGLELAVEGPYKAAMVRELEGAYKRAMVCGHRTELERGLIWDYG